MYKVNQILKIKEGQEDQGLPEEVMVSNVDGQAVHITSTEGTYESTVEILDTFYTTKEEFTMETLPKMTIEELDDIIAQFDIYAATSSPVAGMQVKSKMLALKSNIAKASGLNPSSTISILGKKIA